MIKWLFEYRFRTLKQIGAGQRKSRAICVSLAVGSGWLLLGCIFGSGFEGIVLKSEQQSGRGHLETTFYVLLFPDLVVQVGMRQ